MKEKEWIERPRAMGLMQNYNGVIEADFHLGILGDLSQEK